MIGSCQPSRSSTRSSRCATPASSTSGPARTSERATPQPPDVTGADDPAPVAAPDEALPDVPLAAPVREDDAVVELERLHPRRWRRRPRQREQPSTKRKGRAGAQERAPIYSSSRGAASTAAPTARSNASSGTSAVGVS